MARKQLYRSSHGVYHIYGRCNNSEWFSLPLRLVWLIFHEYLIPLIERYGIEFHTLCLMNNHFHMLISTPRLNVDLFMRDLLTMVSKTIAKKAGRKNHVFGGRYRWSYLEDAESVAYVYKYILRNPVRAGLVKRVEDYPFTTFNKKQRSDFPVFERADPMWNCLRMSEKKRLEWLNLPTPKELEQLIGTALRRYHFSFSKGNEVRKKMAELRRAYGVGDAPFYG